MLGGGGELIQESGQNDLLFNDLLCLAVRQDQDKIGKWLISKGADISARDNSYMTPLHIAVENDAYEIAEILIAIGANVNAPGSLFRTPLYFATSKRMCEFLISKGAAINVRDMLSAMTPLHCAAEYGFPIEVCAALIKAGADIHTKDENGRTPFDIASEFGASSEVLDILNPQGANHSVISEQSEQ